MDVRWLSTFLSQVTVSRLLLCVGRVFVVMVVKKLKIKNATSIYHVLISIYRLLYIDVNIFFYYHSKQGRVYVRKKAIE